MEGDHREVRILNKVVRWTPEGIELEADPRHAELVVRELGLEGAAASKVPGVKPTKEEEASAAGGEPLGKEEARRYRAVAARLNYLAPDRMDLAYSVKEAARSMASPRHAESDWDKLKRLGRYLIARPRLVYKYEWQKGNDRITMYTDSDWAGDKSTCKSTSGGIAMRGTHVIKSYSKQQRTIALSSAEAELHAMVAASAEALGLLLLMRDMGIEAEGEIYGDSTAALGIAQRNGMGKLRHIRVQALWIQEARSEGRLKYRKVLGSRNPADGLTKYMTSVLLDQHVKTIGLDWRDGRAETAPGLCEIQPFDLGILRKEVKFSGAIKVIEIAAEGKMRPTRSATKTRRAAKAEEGADDLNDLNHIIFAEGRPKIKIDVMGAGCSRSPRMYIHTQILSPGTSHARP